MEFNIFQISEEENQAIKDASSKYGEHFELANNIVSFFWEYITSMEDKTLCFESFLNSARKAISLALLSILRRQDVQCQMMMRQFIEAACLAGYAMENRELGSFGNFSEDGSLEINDTAKEKAYKWIQKNYPEDSKVLKNMKGKINELAAHVNIVTATLNLQESGTLNDISQDHIIKQRLWWIGNLVLGVMRFLQNVNKKGKTYDVVNSCGEKFQKLFDENEAEKQRQIQEPWVKKWLEESN